MNSQVIYSALLVLSFIMLFSAFIPSLSENENIIMFPLAVVVFLLFNTRNVNNTYLNLLGDASYSIYLTHGFIVMLFGNLIKRFDFSLLTLCSLVFLPFVFSLVLGVYFYRVVELKVIYKSKLIFS